MGTDVLLLAAGVDDDALASAEALVATCERRWSRFLPDSELCRLNAAAGRPTLVPPETYDLVAAAIDAWRVTDGGFDPTVLGALVASGYDRTFDAIHEPAATPPAPAPGCAGIVLDDALGAVTLPPGVALDLGGIAKGHTADLVVEHLRALGATAALADLGGDIRVWGDAWAIAAAGEVLVVMDGAVATSSVERRRWLAADGRSRHHLIDPATGASTDGRFASVSVVAATASTAEVLAKAAIVAGDVSVVTAHGATGLVQTGDGDVLHLAGIDRYLV